MTTKFVQHGTAFFPTAEENLVTHPRLAAGTYSIAVHPEKGFFFEKVDNLTVPTKRYGNTNKHTERILTTFGQRENQTTGILLSGDKGSGKSMLANNLSVELFKQDIPTIVVNSPFHGESFNKFLAMLSQPVMMMFDEFEKVYSDEDHQQALLTLLAGTYSAYQKLFVFTTNDRYRINKHMLNRPGRIFYHLAYRGMELEAIVEYAKDNLVNQDHLQDLMIVAQTIEAFNFDMLKSLIEEMNRFNEPAREAVALMNIRPESSEYISYVGDLLKDDKPILKADMHMRCHNPLINGVTFSIKNGKKDSDGDAQYNNYQMTRDDLKLFDHDKGELHFANKDGFKIVLRREYTKEFAF